jgi:hypothetical protein
MCSSWMCSASGHQTIPPCPTPPRPLRTTASIFRFVISSRNFFYLRTGLLTESGHHLTMSICSSLRDHQRTKTVKI